MTKRHFEALAAALNESRPILDGPARGANLAWYKAAITQWRSDVRAIASVLIAHNPRFDTRFYAACGYDTTEGAQS